MCGELQFVVFGKCLFYGVDDNMKFAGRLFREKKVWTVIANPGVDGWDLVITDIFSARKNQTRAYSRFGFRIVYQEIHDLIRRKGGHHLNKNFFNLRNTIRPGLGILRPGEPRCSMTMPFGRHAVTEFSGSRHELICLRRVPETAMKVACRSRCADHVRRASSVLSPRSC